MSRYILLLCVLIIPIYGMDIQKSNKEKLATIASIAASGDYDKQDTLLQSETAYTNYPKLISCYQKYYFPIDLNQSKVPHTTVPKNNLWDTATKKITKDTSKTKPQLLCTIKPNLMWNFTFLKKASGKKPQKITIENDKKPLLYYNYVDISQAYYRGYGTKDFIHGTIGRLIFDNEVNYVAFSPDQTKLITLESLYSSTQTEYDLTELLADINSIDAILVQDAYKIAAFMKDDTHGDDSKDSEEKGIKRYLDLLLNNKDLPSAKKQKVS